MILTHIVLDNWMAFAGHHEIELPVGPIAVTARYEDNPDRSNWAGKTAFLEAIEWCLFGVHRKRLDDEIIFHGADSVMVHLELSDGMAVTRSRKRGKSTELKVEMGGVTHIKKQAQAELQTALGIDNVDYRNTQCFVQDDTLAMVDKRSGERRKVVAQWLELDPWLRVAARAVAFQKSIAEKYRHIINRRVGIEEEIEKLDPEELRNNYTNATMAAGEARVDSERAHTTHAEAVASLKAGEAAGSLSAVKEEMRALRVQLTDVGSPEADLDEARAGEEVHAIEAARWSRELKEANRVLGSGFDGTCPVTCEDCPVADEINESRDAVGLRAKDADVKWREAHELQVVAGRGRAAADEQLAEITRRRARFNTLKEQLEDLQKLAKGATKGVTAEMLEVAERARRAALSVEREAEGELRVAEENMKRRQSLIKQLTEANDEGLGIERDLHLATVAAKCVGPTGVPGRIAEGALDDLEERANGLLADSGLAFTFAWDRETTSLAPSCTECGYLFKGVKDKSCPACEAHRGWKRADELEILVDDGTGQPEEVKTKSGGAKVLVASAIRLAAGVMLRDLRGSPCAWAQVDEPFGPLDTENRAMLARTFAGMLSAVGLEQAFVVSHDAALLDALPHRIEVVRKGDRSVVRLVA